MFGRTINKLPIFVLFCDLCSLLKMPVNPHSTTKCEFCCGPDFHPSQSTRHKSTRPPRSAGLLASTTTFCDCMGQLCVLLVKPNLLDHICCFSFFLLILLLNMIGLCLHLAAASWCCIHHLKKKSHSKIAVGYCQMHSMFSEEKN